MTDPESEKEKSSWFGKWGKMPCFRDTFITSITSGIVAGLGYFMFTSKTRMATHVGYGTFFTVTLVYWTQCRYRWSVAKFNYQQLQQAMRNQNLYEGSEMAAKAAEDDLKTV